MEKKFNTGYRVALYNLPLEYKELLQSYFNNPEHFSENTFEITSLEQLEQEKINLMRQPDVLLIGENQELTEEIRNYSKKNMAQIIRITEKPIQNVENKSDMIISISTELIEKKSLTDEQSKTVTQFEYSMELLKNMAQIANTSKLRFVRKKVLEKEQEKVMILDDERTVLDTLMKLNYFIKVKDSYTMMHSDHVSDYAVLLGKELNLDNNALEVLRIGGELHDIGKIGIPDAIIRKQSGLNDQEFDIMKRHTVIGEAILPSNGYQEIKQMIRSHHEKMDGTGYPDGLKQEEIPYFARILSVADTFDAMTTQRSYNRKKTLEEAFQELRRSSQLQPNRFGTLSQQLDPELVEHFIHAVQKDEKLMERFRQQDSEIMNFRREQEQNLEANQIEGRIK